MPCCYYKDAPRKSARVLCPLSPPHATSVCIQPACIDVTVRLPIAVSTECARRHRSGLERIFDCVRGCDQSSVEPSPPHRLLLRSLRAVMSGRSDRRAFLPALRNHHAQRFGALRARSEPACRCACVRQMIRPFLHVLFLFPPENEPSSCIVRPMAITSPLNVVQHASTSPL